MKSVVAGHELPPVPARAVRWNVRDALLVLLGAQLLSILWAVTLLGVAYGPDAVPDPLPITVAALANLGLAAGYFFGPLLVCRTKGNGAVDDLGARVKPADVPLGIALGICTQLVLLPLLYWPISWFVDGDPSEAAKELVALVDTPFEWAVLVLSAVVIAPVVEELFYRGLFLRAVQARLGPVPAAIITSAVFAAVHRQLLPLPGLFVFGLIAAALALYTGRLGPSWALHVGFNATTLVVLGLAG